MLNILFSPSLYLLLSLIFFLRYWRTWKNSRKLIVGGSWFLVFYLTTTPFLFNQIAFQWERKYERFIPEHFSESSNFKIVVLGSGYSHDSELSACNILGESALSRIVEAVKVAMFFPNSTLITSGYSASGKTPGAVVLKIAAIELGLESHRILVQPEPHNTQSEASHFAKHFYAPSDTIVLITSAIHLPRAILHFKNSGVNHVIPAPCDYLTFKDNTYSLKNFIPSFSYFEKLQRLNKEIIGFYFGL